MNNVEMAIKAYHELRAADCTHEEAVIRVGYLSLTVREYAEFRKAMG